MTARQSSKNVFRDATFAWGTWTSARLHAKHGQPAYLYFFDHAQPLGAQQTYEEVDTPDKLGTFHSSEYPYIFGTLDVLSRDWTAADRALSVELQAYWTNFSRSGDPNGGGLPTWPKVDAGGATTMQLGDRTGPGEIPISRRCASSTNGCNAGSNGCPTTEQAMKTSIATVSLERHA